jgi:hypothetical protein
VSLILGYLTLPIALRVVEQSPPPPNVTAEQYQQSLPIIETVTKVFTYGTPLLVIGFTALFAWLIGVMCAMMGFKTKFSYLFSFLAACSLIPVLGRIAAYIVLRAKGDEIQTQQQLSPAFGLDIFLHEGLSPIVVAFLNFFSIFEVWYLIVLTVGLAVLVKTTKMKAFLAITPAWLIPLIFVLWGAARQPK